MTERQRFELEEKRERIFSRDGGMCQHPNCCVPGYELAHLIANTKTNRHLFGDELIDHDLNVKLSCSGHNASFNIGYNIVESEKLCQKIYKDFKRRKHEREKMDI